MLQPDNMIPYELLVCTFDLFSVSIIPKFLSVLPKLAAKVLFSCLFNSYSEQKESCSVFLDIFENVIK